ncbi:hypothetical protein TK0792 [Thermococcus kodakarensis KOD1]|uniref:Uncharacterized protein n=1 Tax=Thermococcus kodakarensis (strain ATCC BAA-918 / JCM 12380 / KOD1) TaxID=69014 RepID=Q5JH88_THEKO|nr:hypothetical protein [Thermococcus kodakarensis]WCN28805.1 hypothetical protein POG15_04045 [Thermococcus kodakarensis]WCN31105.1 hypothetical protein POG21_04045 [Thermococcus kodakarensis]BAD84981.1 hypothetical protein TK0792 [Thermococcus kodakarensis KOD1]
MSVTLVEIQRKIDEIEKFLKELIEVNLQLIEESEPEEWEIKEIQKRRKDEFMEWDVVKDEL